MLILLNILHYKNIFFGSLLGASFIICLNCNDFLIKQANLGQFDAQFSLTQQAIAKKNIKEALSWISKAQKQKNEDNLLKLASMLLEYSITTLDQKAAIILHHACQLQSSEAAYKLAELYKSGIGVNVNLRHSLKWLEKAAKLGHIDAQFELSKATKKISIDKSNYWLQQAALNGNIDAHLKYAKILLDQDSEKATIWMLRESTSDNSNNLVTMALNKSVANSKFTTTQQIQLLTRAHKLGNIKASSHLIKYISSSRPKTALQIAKHAAANGESEGQYQYAVLLESDTQDQLFNLQNVVELYRSAASQDHPSALNKLGQTLLQHPTLSLNLTEPYLSILRAAQLGVSDAQFQLGNWYYTGISHNFSQIKKNPKSALKWYIKAANQGHSQASYKIGFFHEHGIATEIDLITAIKWYKTAKRNGSKKAKIALLRVSKKQSIFSKVHSWWNKY